jgi:hypothetical protein
MNSRLFISQTRLNALIALMFWPVLVLADACEFRTACPYDGQTAQLGPAVRYGSLVRNFTSIRTWP